ncbi:hypothetical protein AAFF_G00257670 [Aldrovandia affinis]|uniref:Uncharacterized protein n=1 Tax=Aldrovandia affinis TaxID=143900 RepID=A0AAD7STE3_9TELE|nr:hypothetical protein AAFF_G00257670 [Aldrovandia affinis]
MWHRDIDVSAVQHKICIVASRFITADLANVYSDHACSKGFLQTINKIIRFYPRVHLVLQVMENDTDTTPDPGVSFSSNSRPTALGLGVGLPLVLVAVAAVLAAVRFTRRCRSSNIPQADELKTTEDSVQNVANPRYIAPVVRPPPTQLLHQQEPVYENFKSGGQDLTQNRQDNTMDTNIQRQESHTEDLYLQCDPQDDSIYSNDPSCFHHSTPPDPSYDDQYIMPDML